MNDQIGQMEDAKHPNCLNVARNLTINMQF